MKLYVEGIKDRLMIEACYEMFNMDMDIEIVEMNGISHIKEFHGDDIFFLTDNDKAGKEWVKAGIPGTMVITDAVYDGEEMELEEFLSGQRHHKNKGKKKRLIKEIIDLNMDIARANHLMQVIAWYKKN